MQRSKARSPTQTQPTPPYLCKCEPGSHTGGQSSASSNVTHISPYLPHPAPLVPTTTAARFASGRAGRASISCWASPLQDHPAQALLGQDPDWADACTTTRLTYRMPALMPSSPRRRDTPNTTHHARAPPSPPHAGVSMPSRKKPSRSITPAGHDIRPVAKRPSYTGKVASP